MSAQPCDARPLAARRASRSTMSSSSTIRDGGAGVLAVDHCSLRCAAGEICMIVGPSGCGKTTLAQRHRRLSQHRLAAHHLDGEVLCGPARPKAEIGSDRIVVFQNGALFPWKTNLENVAFGPIVQRKLTRKEAYEKARDMMAEAGLRGYRAQISRARFHRACGAASRSSAR